MSPAAVTAWPTPASALHCPTCGLTPEARGRAPCPSTTKRQYRTPRVRGVALQFLPSVVYLRAYAESVYARTRKQRKRIEGAGTDEAAGEADPQFLATAFPHPWPGPSSLQVLAIATLRKLYHNPRVFGGVVKIDKVPIPRATFAVPPPPYRGSQVRTLFLASCTSNACKKQPKPRGQT